MPMAKRAITKRIGSSAADFAKRYDIGETIPFLISLRIDMNSLLRKKTVAMQSITGGPTNQMMSHILLSTCPWSLSRAFK